MCFIVSTVYVFAYTHKSVSDYKTTRLVLSSTNDYTQSVFARSLYPYATSGLNHTQQHTMEGLRTWQGRSELFSPDDTVCQGRSSTFMHDVNGNELLFP